MILGLVSSKQTQMNQKRTVTDVKFIRCCALQKSCLWLLPWQGLPYDLGMSPSHKPG
jgi:hypothetical protein